MLSLCCYSSWCLRTWGFNSDSWPAGLSTCHYIWAFHSEAEEELLNMLPCMQKGEPTWPELKAMGVGWWLRSTNKLRRCIEKVGTGKNV